MYKVMTRPNDKVNEKISPRTTIYRVLIGSLLALSLIVVGCSREDKGPPEDVDTESLNLEIETGTKTELPNEENSQAKPEAKPEKEKATEPEKKEDGQ